MGLEGAQTIGGVAVEITGDLSKLRAAHAEAKTISTEISKLQPKVQVGGALGPAGGSVNGGFAALSFAAGRGATLDPNAVNYSHGFQAIQSRAAQAGVAAAQGDIASRAGLDQRLLATRMATARELGEKEGAAEAEANVTAYNRTKRRLASSPGSGEGVEGGAFGRFAHLNPFSPRGLDRAFGSALVGFAVAEGLKTIGGFARSGQMMNSGNLDTRMQGQLARMDTVGGIPLIGHIQESLDSFQASGAAPHWMARYGGRNTAREAIQTNLDDIAKQRGAVESAIVNKWGTKSALAMLTGDDIGAARFSGEGRLSAARREVLNGGGGEAVANLDRQKQINSIELKNAQQHQLMSDASSFLGMASGASQLMAINFVGAGQSEAGAVAMTRARRLALQRQQADRMGSATNDRDRAKIGDANKAELTVFDAQAGLDAQERKKNKAIDTETAIASKQEATLRMAHRGYEADLAAFDAATKAKIDAIDDLDAKQNESTRRAAQRAVMVQQQQEQLKASRAQLASTGDVALMRAGHQGQAAALKEFDDQTKAMLSDPNRNAALDPDVRDSRAKQRKALEQQQAEDRVSARASVNARIGIAGAQGAGMEQLAGTIGAVAGMKQELRGAEETNKAGIVQAQEAELRSMQQQILAPRRFATEFDPTREATGGPGGDAAKETNTLLKIMSDYLKALVDKGPAAAAG